MKLELSASVGFIHNDRIKVSWVQNVTRRTQNDELAEAAAVGQAGNKHSNNQVS
jgi:cell division inhibitor SulA